MFTELYKKHGFHTKFFFVYVESDSSWPPDLKFISWKKVEGLKICFYIILHYIRLFLNHGLCPDRTIGILGWPFLYKKYILVYSSAIRFLFPRYFCLNRL